MLTANLPPLWSIVNVTRLGLHQAVRHRVHSLFIT